MRASTWMRLRSTLALLVVALTLAVIPQTTRPTPAAAAPVQNSTLSICGLVTAYSAATGVANGSITIAGTPYTIVMGTAFTGSGATALSTFNPASPPSLCFVLTLNVGGFITAGVVSVNAAGSRTVCGVVSAYTPGSSITINGQAFSIVPGTTFTGSAAGQLGLMANPNLCIAFTLNGLGQITGGVVTPNALTVLSICGATMNYTAAGVGTSGTITIGGQAFVIAAGAVITGAAAGQLGNPANPVLCFQLTLNAANQIVAATVTTQGTGTGTGTMQICGPVTAYTPGSSITIAGQTLTIAAGTVPTGASIVLSTNYCVVFTFNAAGQVVAFAVQPNLPAVNIVCGVFTSYTPAYGLTQSYIVIGGIAFLVNTQVFAPTYLVSQQVYCFLLSPTGQIIGILSGVPTSIVAANVEGTRAAQRSQVIAERRAHLLADL